MVGRKFHTFVGHESPDIDVFGGFWLADNAGLGTPNHRYVYVPAGKRLPGFEKDPGVLYIDTGGGPFDQHGKELARTCSTALLADKLGLGQAPGLKEILEWVKVFDNDEAYFPDHHIHHVVTAIPNHQSCKGSDGKTDWEKVRVSTYEHLDSFFNQVKGRHTARLQFPTAARSMTLPTGLVVFSYPRRYFYSEVALESGGDIGIQFHEKGEGRFFVGIKVFRGKNVDLTKVAALLRHFEARRRGFTHLDARTGELSYLGEREPLPGWFLHDSRRVVSCGSMKRELKDHEYTKLTQDEIEKIVHIALADTGK